MYDKVNNSTKIYYAYLRLLVFLPGILIPAWASSSPAFLMMHSAYKLNKQGDNALMRPFHEYTWTEKARKLSAVLFLYDLAAAAAV